MSSRSARPALTFAVILCSSTAIAAESLDTAVPALLARWNAPGASVAVMKGGQLVYANAFGVADRGSNRPVSLNSLFQIGSISKLVTATCILRLIEQGKLTLDTPAFPLLNLGTPADPRVNQITIRHLLSHGGGWDRDISGDPFDDLVAIARAMSVPSPPAPATIVRYMLTQPLDFAPGVRFAYSNVGYTVLGRVIEKLTGQSYETYAASLLAEIGISDMRIGRGLPEERPTAEVRYYTDTTATFPSVYDRAPGNVALPDGIFAPESSESAGGWIASATSLAKFVASFDANAQRHLISPASFARMVEPVFTLSSSGSVNYWQGLGWVGNSYGNVWHTGVTGGAQSITVKAANGYQWVFLGNLAIHDPAPGSRYASDMDATMWSAVGSRGVHTVTASQSDCLFRWAERTYPQHFAPAGTASATLAPYNYRYYSGTGNYLATSVADQHLWVYGPAFGSRLLDVGPGGGFLATAGCS